ncbi:MAG: DUF5668 domain-containing protein [Candidatus Korobacteraceae bacterium]
MASQLGSALPPPGTAAVPPGAQPVAGVGSPRLAALLGFIPGVGAMYNGEYAKGFIHVLILGTLIWLCAAMDRGQVVFGLLIGAFLIYMPIEAYKTAKAREMGLPAPDPFGLNHLFSAGGPAPNPTPRVAAGAAPLTATTPSTAAPEGQPADAECCPPSRVPIGAFVLIGLGVLFLLNEMNVVNFDRIWRFWPLVLIAVGIRVLIRRRGMGW